MHIDRTDRKSIGLLVLLVLITTVPFLKRAYFVDDFYFVTIARGILQHPLRPYDFLSDDEEVQTVGWERGKAPRMVNPVLFHYYLAGVIKLFGDASWKLRASTLVFSLTAVVCVYFLGKRFVLNPLAAAALFAVTPAYWLTSYSLLIDGALIAFFLLSLLVFLHAVEERRTTWIGLAGVLMGLTMLVKYVGALVLVVGFIWQMMDGRRRTWWPGYFAYFAAAAVMSTWGVWNIVTYGQMHFFAALPRGFHGTSFGGLGLLALFFIGFSWPQRRTIRGISPALLWSASAAILLVGGLLGSASIKDWISGLYLDKILVLGSFLGGCTVFLWLAIPLLIRRKPWGAAALAGVSSGLYLVFHSRAGGFDRLQSFMLIFFFSAAIAFLILANGILVDDGQSESRFLFAWILVGVVELIVVMPWTAGRYLLIILPPVCWGFERIVERMGSRWLSRFAWILTACVGISLAYGDYSQANAIKALARILSAKSAEFERLSDRRQHRWYYLSDTFDGSQPYLAPLGWQNIFPSQPLQPGDLFLKPHFRRSSWWKVTHPERFRLLEAFSISSRNPLRVMDVPASAGFYASCWGALPFAVTGDPLERFELYQVVESPSL